MAASPSPRSGRVHTPDGDLYYEVHGQGSPIILVAGGPGAARTSLMPEFDRLAPDHSVIYFDNIGRGRSSDLPAGRRHSPNRDAEDVEYLRAALNLERFFLLGHSYGGRPALVYAARHPERLRGLVISDSGHSAESSQHNIDTVNRFVENQYPQVWAQLSQMRAAGLRTCAPEYQALLGQTIAQLYWFDPSKALLRKPASSAPEDRFRSSVYCDLLGEDSEVVIGGAMASFDIRAALHDVDTPTLITVGRHDILCPPRVAIEIRDAFPAGVAQVRIFESSSHRPWVEEADSYFKELSAFLAEH